MLVLSLQRKASQKHSLLIHLEVAGKRIRVHGQVHMEQTVKFMVFQIQESRTGLMRKAIIHQDGVVPDGNHGIRMRIAVIAANGKSGQAFVHAALAAGHEVVAGVHRSNPFTDQNDLTVKTCNATDLLSVGQLIHGCDCVVNLIGHVKGSPATVQTDATKVIAAAMEQQQIKRYVGLTGTAVRMPGDRITLIDRIMNAAITVIDPKRIKDSQNHISILQNSQLDWTVVRVLKLTDAKPGSYYLSDHGPVKTFTSRNEVAQIIVTLIEQNSYLKQLPIIAKV